MTQFDLNASEIYLKERRNFDGKHPAKFALYFVCWLVVISSFMGAVS